MERVLLQPANSLLEPAKKVRISTKFCSFYKTLRWVGGLSNYDNVIKYAVFLMASLREQLQQHVKDTTAPYKYPRKIEFVDQLPKTVSLKIKRGELRNKELKA